MKYLPWLLSALTIATMWLAGNRSIWAWRIALVNQALWLWWIASTQTWGLVPMNAAMWVVTLRNLAKWRALSSGGSE